MVKKLLPDLIKKAFAGRSKNSIIQNIEGEDFEFSITCSIRVGRMRITSEFFESLHTILSP